MRNRILTIAALISMVLVASVVSASEIRLTNSNVPQLAGVDVRVIQTGTTFSVQLVTNPLTNTPVGFDKFYYNLDNPVISASETEWDFNYGGMEASGFGPFSSKQSKEPAGPGGINSPVVFILSNSIPSSIPANDHNARFAVHIRWSKDCSGWISDGTSTSTSSDNNCRPKTEIPEIPKVALPIAAAIGLLFFFQQRNKKEE